ncbi:MAG: glycosyltransferase [Rhizobiales bacterium]|nr:glycosyltransferase [Hyphomicrobiales bacterium]
MRIFQNSGLTRGYLPRLRTLTRDAVSFREQRDAFLADGYGAAHILKPVLNDRPDAFFTNGDDPALQKAWARENGLKANTSLEDILLAQIEEHRSEVFYNLDCVTYQSAFLRRLPGSVKRRLSWRAAVSGKIDLTGYDAVLCNFPSFIARWTAAGVRAVHFCPSHDPVLDMYAVNEARTIDVLFAGTVSQHHTDRIRMLGQVAALAGACNVRYLLTLSRLTRLAGTPAGLIGPLRKYRLPQAVTRIAAPGVFGRDLYRALASAKIVLNVNGLYEIVGRDRGNMRCWEALGAAALMVSDEGDYPDGMVPGEMFRTFRSVDEVVGIVKEALRDPAGSAAIARKGHNLVRNRYSKERQWEDFVALL